MGRSGGAVVARACALSVAFVLVAACSGQGGGSVERTRSSSAPIINGSPATQYPESALIDLYQSGQLVAGCSGSVIAPQVVLTAGHCVTGEPGITPNGWVVTAPYANNQQVQSTNAIVYDWVGNSSTVNPNYHDIGIVFLPTPITLSSYPVLEAVELAPGSQIVNIGRRPPLL